MAFESLRRIHFVPRYARFSTIPNFVPALRINAGAYTALQGCSGQRAVPYVAKTARNPSVPSCGIQGVSFSFLFTLGNLPRLEESKPRTRLYFL